MSFQSLLRCFTASISYCYRIPGFPDQSPRILSYHGVSDHPLDKWSVTPTQLRRQVRWMIKHCNPVSLNKVIEWIKNRRALPKRAVAITFDDGYKGVLEHAAPIFKEYNIPATLFVPTGLINFGPVGASSSYTPTEPLLNWNEVQTLHKSGWQIGSHTVSHPILSTLTNKEIRSELVDSRKELEERLGVPVDYLAYPFGVPSAIPQSVVEIAKECGYKAAFMNTIGKIDHTTNLMQVNRCKVLGTDFHSAFKASLSGRMDLWRNIETIK